MIANPRASQPAWLVLAMVLAFAADGLGASHAVPAPEFDSAFERHQGWIGGDGAYSVPLGPDRRLWLFGDSLVGTVANGRRQILAMPRNAIAIQTGNDLATATMRFAFGRDARGRIGSRFVPPDGRGWLWPLHGIRTAQGLALFFTQMESTGTGDPFDFHPVGSWLFLVANPDDVPERWTMRTLRVPFGRYDPDNQRVFGTSVVGSGEFLYVYGTAERRRTGAFERRLLVARVARNAIGDFARWRFRAGPRWSPRADDAAGIVPDVATELSVTLDRASARYVLVTSARALSARIVWRTAPRPEGPWGPPVILHTCAEPDGRSGIFCYAAKAHEGLADRTGDLVVSYVCNAMTPDTLTATPSIYRPRFLRLSLVSR